MRPICWLHISDLHTRIRDAWSQDVVLKAMCDHIAQQRIEGMSADFILATGDLAFSGKADEYPLPQAQQRGRGGAELGGHPAGDSPAGAAGNRND